MEPMETKISLEMNSWTIVCHSQASLELASTSGRLLHSKIKIVECALCICAQYMHAYAIIRTSISTSRSILIKHESCLCVCVLSFSEATKSPRVMKIWL